MAKRSIQPSRQAKLPIIELFGPTIQGEGKLIGQRSHFVRLGGCSYRCTWCDSMQAVDPELIKKNRTMMSAAEIASAIDKLDPAPWVTISGGDPGQFELTELVHNLACTHLVAIETQGAFSREWFKACNLITVSPKAPSSGMDKKINYEVLDAIVDMPHHADCRASVIFKVVVFDDKDLTWAVRLHKKYGNTIPFYIGVGTRMTKGLALQSLRNVICEDMRELFNKALKNPLLSDVTILPQLHTLAWGRELKK